ncbi:2OG-Fe dioxygenase family protein [Thaumasiovibrio sp. DFM-14]|uniref:2OG-Fe dioxygenase family protein n=1 Tax=Thaumasiovibrio sp. DFM-14 TaxID=3384792 RepID=UPI0039A017A7
MSLCASKNVEHRRSEHSEKSFFGQGYMHIPSREIIKSLKISTDQMVDFADYWNRLFLDKYMGDKGTYRFRRYGQCDFRSASRLMVWCEHQAYVQSHLINALNGGIARYFEPLEEGFKDHYVLQRLTAYLASQFDEQWGAAVNWRVRVHPYRIIATDNELGLPTPEGLHRDGVTFITSIMIRRYNILGGRTTVTNQQGEELASIELSDPFELVVADDEKTMHQVSPISVENGRIGTAYRDVLVIAFTHPSQL